MSNGVHGFFERELTLVEGGADDDGAGAGGFQRPDVFEGGDAAAGDDGDVDGVNDACDRVGPDAGELPLDVDVGEEDSPCAEVGVMFGGRGRIQARALGPPGDDHLAVLGVEAHQHRPEMGFGYLGDDVGILDGGGPEDDAVEAGVQQSRGVRDGTDPPAQLHVDGGVDSVDDGGDGVGVFAFALEGAVEVDQVERAGARRDPAPGGSRTAGTH